MDIIVPTTNGKTYPAWLVQAADRFIELTKTKTMWEMLDFIVDVWMRKNVKNTNELIAEVSKMKSTRKNKYAATENKWGELTGNRYLGEIPTEIQTVIDMFYSDQVEEMGTRKFYYAFLKRYPIFRVADKL